MVSPPSLPVQPPAHHLTHPQVFIFGTNFTETRLVARALQSFYGIGPQLRTTLMSRFHIHQTARIGDLSTKQIDDLAAELGTMTIENDARRGVVENIKRLRDMGTFRGRRHAMGLPVRGQRTRSQVSLYTAVMEGMDGWRDAGLDWNAGEVVLIVEIDGQISTARKLNRVDRREGAPRQGR